MKVLVTAAPTMDQVRASLASQFPQYPQTMRGPGILVVKKSRTAAALVMIRKNKIVVNEAFPSVGGQMLFSVSMILLGILIPLIIYFTAFFPAQKALTKEVGEYLSAVYAGK